MFFGIGASSKSANRRILYIGTYCIAHMGYVAASPLPSAHVRLPFPFIPFVPSSQMVQHRSRRRRAGASYALVPCAPPTSAPLFPAPGRKLFPDCGIRDGALAKTRRLVPLRANREAGREVQTATTCTRSGAMPHGVSRLPVCLLSRSPSIRVLPYPGLPVIPVIDTIPPVPPVPVLRGRSAEIVFPGHEIVFPGHGDSQGPWSCDRAN